MNLNFDIGYRGEPETVLALALNTKFPGSIDSFLSGCMEAYKENRPDNLQQMFAGFIKVKMDKPLNAACQREMTMHRAIASLDACDRMAQFEPQRCDISHISRDGQAVLAAPAVWADKTLSCRSTVDLPHFGQTGFSEPRINSSNSLPQLLQAYS